MTHSLTRGARLRVLSAVGGAVESFGTEILSGSGGGDGGVRRTVVARLTQSRRLSQVQSFTVHSSITGETILNFLGS